MIEKLKEVLTADDTILFVGSGVSRWSNLPTWEGLLYKLADRLTATGRNGQIVKDECSTDLLLAASYGFDQLTPSEIGQFMRDACLVGTATPHLIHQKLAALTPRCFITTNYDKLLEDGLRQWRPERPLRVVTNRQQVDVADLFGLRTTDFVFKPHGDIDDSESVILTREHYRKLLDGGEYKHALRALEMLLATRQVVYLGFGLRDLDFLLLRDALANSFKGGIRDHYAIMPDVKDHERDFWRRNYGIHLVSYPVDRSTPKHDHSALLNLLDNLAVDPTPHSSRSKQDQSAVLLKVLRLVSGQMRFVELSPTFPLRVRKVGLDDTRRVTRLQDPFSGRPASDFLQTGPKHSILIGLPGSGKTYRLKQAAAALARGVHEHYLGSESANSNIVVPIYVDLKLYNGSLIDLIESNLPEGLNLELLASTHSIKIFLDSFNEIPRQQVEGKLHESDFSTFISKFQNVAILVGSRTNDGLRELKFEEYSLDEIDGDFVQKFLDEKGIQLNTHFEFEMRSVLQRPFYFQLAYSSAIPILAASRPKDIYEALVGSIAMKFEEKFGHILNLMRALPLAAYDALNRGEEAILATDFCNALTREDSAIGPSSTQLTEVLNFLISCDIVIPYSGGRIAFFHQSITEYLASLELARRFELKPEYLTQKLALRRWDQALFLTFSQLPPAKASKFVKRVVRIDFELAMRATKYVEHENRSIVTALLKELLLVLRKMSKSAAYHTQIFWAAGRFLEESKIDASHTKALWEITELGGSVGAAAAARQLDISSNIEQTKAKLLAEMRIRRDDFNFCYQLGGHLSEFISIQDLPLLVSMTDEMKEDLEKEEEPAGYGLATGISHLLRKLPLADVADALLNATGPEAPNKSRQVVLCGVLENRFDQTGLDLARRLFNCGIDESIFSLHMITAFSKEKLVWDEPIECSALIDALGRDVHSGWAVGVIEWLCNRHPTVKAYTTEQALRAKGVRRIALSHAIGDQQMMFETLEELLKFSKDQLDAEPVDLIDKLSIKWGDRGELLRRLFGLRHNALAIALIEASEAVENFPLGEVHWWLEWIIADDSESGWWLAERLSTFFADYLSLDDQKKFVTEFNRRNSKYRPVLEGSILKRILTLTTDDLTEEALTYLKENRTTSPSMSFDGELLGKIATESFAEHLVPLVSSTRGSQREYLVGVLEEAGHRHGRRYLIDIAKPSKHLSNETKASLKKRRNRT